jgi:hypothetical protein
VVKVGVAVSAPDPFDDIARMVEQLDISRHLDEVHALNNHDLVRRYNSVKEELKARRELVEARTDEGRDLHSEHTALLHELHERHLR